VKIVIVGAGGHAQVVADILFQMQAVEPIGYLDDRVELLGSKVLGLPVLGTVAQLVDIEHDGVVIGIGNNQVRQKLFQKMSEAGERMVSAIHPSALVSPRSHLGRGIQMSASAVINPSAFIDDNVIINTGATIDHHNRIGAHTHIAPGVTLGGDVVVGKGVLVGIGSTVMPQTTIGDGVVVGAGACVCNNIDPDCVVVGVPARKIRGRNG